MATSYGEARPAAEVAEAGNAVAAAEADSEAEEKKTRPVVFDPSVVPTDLQVVSATSDSILLSWFFNVSAPLASRIDGYRVFSRRESFVDIKTIVTGNRHAKFEIKGLLPYTEYRVFVRGIVAGVESRDSEHLVALTDVTRPTAPRIENVTCYDGGGGRAAIYVQWRRPGTFYRSVDYYKIFFRAEEDLIFSNMMVQAGSGVDQKVRYS